MNEQRSLMSPELATGVLSALFEAQCSTTARHVFRQRVPALTYGTAQKDEQGHYFVEVEGKKRWIFELVDRRKVTVVGSLPQSTSLPLVIADTVVDGLRRLADLLDQHLSTGMVVGVIGAPALITEPTLSLALGWSVHLATLCSRDSAQDDRSDAHAVL